MFAFLRSLTAAREHVAALRRGLNHRRLELESLEDRRLLAGDIVLTSFTADGRHLVVGYQAVAEVASPFTLSLYSSTDGRVPTQHLQSIAVEPDATSAGETGEALIDAHFADLDENEYLLARVELPTELVAAEEEVEQIAFEGGVFQDSHGGVRIYGTSRSDLVNTYQFGVLGITFNGALYQFDAASGSSITVHHAEDEDIILTGETGATTVNGPLDPPAVASPSSPYSGPEGETPVPPHINTFLGIRTVGDMWVFSGTVWDDGPLHELEIFVEFGGEVETTTVGTGGNFSIGIYIPHGTSGFVNAWAVDGDDMMSTLAAYYVMNGGM